MAKNKVEKAAEKALDKAKDAVAEAKRTAKKAGAKAKRRAAKVESQLKLLAAKIEKDAAKRAKKDARAKKAAPARATKPAKVSVPSEDDVVIVPAVAEPAQAEVSTPTKTRASALTDEAAERGDLSALTVVQLRGRAREKGLTGYGKFTKAQLIASLAD